MKIPFIARLVINKFFFHKLVALSLLLVFFTVFKDFFLIFLFTFLFAYLFLDLTRWLQTNIVTGLQVTQSTILQYVRRFFQSESRIVSLLYIIFVCALVFLFSNLIPQLLSEGKGLLQDIPRYFQSLQNAAHTLESGSSVPLGISENISKIVSPEAVESALRSTIENLKNIGLFIIKICIALILSFVFIHDRKKIGKFLTSMKRGSFGFIYDEYEIIFEKISRGFGLIFKAQSIIASVNAALTTIGLICISLLYHGGTFPYITTIALMVFIFGFIPVLGFIISSVPIIVLAFNYGGVEVVVMCAFMIAIVHAVEAYYLNPKIVSNYMEFPVFVTFIILLVSEHFFGFIGLLVGVPLFYILLDILSDVDIYIGKISRVSQSIQSLKTSTDSPIQKTIRLSRSQKFQNHEGNSPQ